MVLTLNSHVAGLDIASSVVVIVAWFAIVLTGRFPPGMLGFVERVIRLERRGDRLHPYPRRRLLPAVPASPMTPTSKPGERCPAGQVCPLREACHRREDCW